MASAYKMRMNIGLGILGTVVASLCVVQAAQAAEPEKMTRARVFNESEEIVQIEIRQRGRKTLVAEVVLPGENIGFEVLKRDCRWPLQARVNNRLHRLNGNLCPENFPDEEKTIYLLSPSEVILVGEDRD